MTMGPLSKPPAVIEASAEITKKSRDLVTVRQIHDEVSKKTHYVVLINSVLS